MAKAFETTGYTIKEETVDLLKHNIMPNTMVVDVNHPFPGYHGMPTIEQSKPRSILLLTKEKYSWEKILRTSSRIDEFTDYKLNSASATIKFGNNSYNGIRIKGLPSYEEIPIVQHAFAEEGFKFMKKRKMADNQVISMKVSKFYNVQNIDDKIFRDTQTEHMFYIEIPHQLNWELFRKITFSIKNNISNRNYDVVLGVFFMRGTVVDMIRIFKPNISNELLNEIRDKYYKEINRYF